ncbi:hypothetical protein [Qipengyuania soli]|uniref:Serine kinase n=1 Tax=Qipengyuania soli TaxID=2782568 RepID=A0A7S8F5U2_9SPHN|nr:hypothetical protein [Qipengyuania soli]QPC99538.1 hypothetical protein IRL76_02915 [Qipengyuania soli]
MHRYRHSGLEIVSEIALPEWDGFASSSASHADIKIELSDERSPAFPRDGSTYSSGSTAGFCIEGVGGWELEAGRRMTLYPSLAVDPAELRLFTLGSAWGVLGYQRGDPMWHGSAVELDGRAALFCGDAGEGKSTMAAAMVATGARLVGDDLSKVEPNAGGALIHPSSSRLKLWGAAVDHFGWRERVVQRDVMREDKFHCHIEPNHAGGPPLPLAAIVVLESGEAPLLEPLSGSEALAEVLSGTIYRPEALETMGRWGEQGALAARIIAGAKVFRLTRPRDLGAIGESAGLVSEMLDRLG